MLAVSEAPGRRACRSHATLESRFILFLIGFWVRGSSLRLAGTETATRIKLNAIVASKGKLWRCSDTPLAHIARSIKLVTLITRKQSDLSSQRVATRVSRNATKHSERRYRGLPGKSFNFPKRVPSLRIPPKCSWPDAKQYPLFLIKEIWRDSRKISPQSGHVCLVTSEKGAADKRAQYLYEGVINYRPYAERLSRAVAKMFFFGGCPPAAAWIYRFS